MKTYKFTLLAAAACTVLVGATAFAGTPIVYQTVGMPVYYTPSCANGMCGTTSSYYPVQTWYYSSLPATGTVIYTAPAGTTTYTVPSVSTPTVSKCGPNGCPVPGTTYVLPSGTAVRGTGACTTGNCPTVPSYSTYKVVPAGGTATTVSTPAAKPSGVGGGSVRRESPFYP